MNTSRRNFLLGFLATAAVIGAGAKVIRDNNKQSKSASLEDDFLKACNETEGNEAILYDDKGAVTSGQGVHLQDFAIAEGMVKYRLTAKDGKRFSLTRATLNMCRALSQNPANITKYPAFQLARTATPYRRTDSSRKLPNLFAWEDAKGTKHPRTARTGELFILNAYDIKALNTMACRATLSAARRLCPFFDSLPRGIQLTTADLIYNCGSTKYSNQFKKYQAALNEFNKTKNTACISTLIAECKTKNSARRNEIRQAWLKGAQKEFSPWRMALRKITADRA